MRYDAGEVITAMVTPMNLKREVDYDKVESLSRYLIEHGSDSVLVCATTGECPTLTHDEETEIISSAKRGVANKAKIIASAGSNSTETAIMCAKKAQKEEVDAILSVVPYYNKPSQVGIIEHFSAIAKSVDLPVIMYNIPSRTGVTMQASTIAYLANEFDNIVGLKQSCADMDLLSETRMLCPDDFVIYSGDDSLTLPMLSVGASGVISVASHLFGNEIKTMINNFKTGKVCEARKIHNKLFPAFKKLFMAPNPVPIKAVLAYRQLIEEYVRKPLVELNENEKMILFSTIESIGMQQ